MKTEKLNENEKELLQNLNKIYFFGMFKQIGLAKNDQEEYKLRNTLEGLIKSL